jgi:hypothetical protein
LEKELPESAVFWTGTDYETIFSREHSYAKQQERKNFKELQLFTHVKEVDASLRYLLEEDNADDPIDVDGFGKIAVIKSNSGET